MGFWWVNHKQTFKQEVGGGYIWSPKAEKNGARSQFYINLTLTKVNDTIFSYADGYIRAIGRVTKQCQDHPRPNEFGDVGEQWDRDGWLVRVEWELLETPISPKANISQIRPLLPEKYSPIRKNGTGNQKCYLAAINETLADALFLLARAGG